MKRKKILFVYYKLIKPGGIARVLVNLANELAKDYEVSILLLTARHKSFYELDASVRLFFADSFDHWAFRKVNVTLNKYFRWLPYRRNIKNYFYDYGAWQTLSAWLKKHGSDFDFIIGCQYKLSIQLALNNRYNFKSIAWEHTDYQVGGIVFSTLRKRSYKRLKAVVTINVPSTEYYKTLNGNTVKIYNIIGEPFESAEFREDKKSLLSFVGRLDEEKNVQELIEIFLKSGLSNTWKLQIAGDGPERENLENLVVEKQLQNAVVFYGNQTSAEIKELLQNSKIFVFTSLKENLPTVLIEALFCGNILIAYDCEFGPSDIVNQNNGFLIPLRDKETFVKTLKAIASDEERLKEMNRSSFEDAENWNKKLLIKKWEEVIKTSDSETEKT